MGKKGIKAFVKSAMRTDAPATADEACLADTTEFVASTCSVKPSAPSTGSTKQATVESGVQAASDDSDAEGQEAGEESQGQMTQRHKRVHVMLRSSLCLLHSIESPCCFHCQLADCNQIASPTSVLALQPTGGSGSQKGATEVWQKEQGGMIHQFA